MALWPTDNKLETNEIKRKIVKKTKHGFQTYMYLSSDDSKHFKCNRHVLLLSHFDESTSNEDHLTVLFEPTFRLVSTAPNKVKSDNYKKNADDIISLLGIETAVFLNGGLNDNAPDAQKEIRLTVEGIFRRVDLTGDEELMKHVHIKHPVFK